MWFPCIRYGLTNSENLLPNKVDFSTCISECYLKNNVTLMKLWGWAQDNVSDSDIKTRIIGVQTKMQILVFFYGLQLAIVVLSNSDNLNSSLQRAELYECMLKRKPSFLLLFFKVYDQTGMQTSIGPRSIKLLRSWSDKYLHFHVAVRCHQCILRVMLNLSTIPI